VNIRNLLKENYRPSVRAPGHQRALCSCGIRQGPEHCNLPRIVANKR
jgi:hypothetical protein